MTEYKVQGIIEPWLRSLVIFWTPTALMLLIIHSLLWATIASLVRERGYIRHSQRSFWQSCSLLTFWVLKKYKRVSFRRCVWRNSQCKDCSKVGLIREGFIVVVGLKIGLEAQWWNGIASTITVVLCVTYWGHDICKPHSFPIHLFCLYD